jgi:hypothetical protein
MVGQASGLGVDSSGNPVIDPSENVKETVAAEVRRLDDLAARDREHVREMMQLERAHSTELRQLETARLDAVRAVDVGAVQTAAAAAENRAAALGATVAAAAEAMRATAEASRLAATETLNSAVKPLADAISVIQGWINQQTGQRAQVVETRETRGSGRGDLTAVIMMIGVLVAIVLGVVGLFVK